MTEERKDVKIAAVSVLRQPKESKAYEAIRIATNLSIQSKLCMMKAKFVQQRAGDVSFLGLDRVLTSSTFVRDGIHLNAEGDARLGGRVLAWIKEKVREL